MEIDSVSTSEHCIEPVDLVPAVSIPACVMKPVVEHAAEVALAFNDAVVIKGCTPRAAIYCRGACRYHHDGGLIVMPDVLVIEMLVNGATEVIGQRIDRRDGRSCQLFAITGETMVPL